MSAPILTVFTDDPCPRVEVFFESFAPGTATVTVYRMAAGREFKVRGAVRAPTSGSLTRIDFEVPFNMPVSYRAEQFDAAGLPLGFTETGTVGDRYSAWVESARNLWKTPAMSNVAMVTAQGSTLAVVADGLRITSTGSSPYRATTNASQRVPVSPSTSYWVTARRIIGSAIGTAASTSGKMSVVGYDSAGSHRSNAYSVSLGSAPTPGTEIIEQQITTPDWVVSLEVNFVSGSNNGDEVVWGRVAIATGVGYFSGDTPSSSPLERYSWTAGVNASPSVRESRAYAGTGVPAEESWMHNPLDPQGSVRVEFGADTAQVIKRPTPGVVSRPLGRRVGVVLSEPRQGVTGFPVVIRTSSDEDADRVQAMVGDNGMPPVVCLRLGGMAQRTRVPQPLFLSTLTVEELEMNHAWGGNELAHRFDGDEVDPPIPGLFVPLLTRADLNAYYATRGALNAAYLRRMDVNRDYSLAGAGG